MAPQRKSRLLLEHRLCLPRSRPTRGTDNLTIRQHSRRVGRRVNVFSKERDYLEYQLTLSFPYYHFAVPHRGLRQRLAQPVSTNGLNARQLWQPG
jgi:hypothetical protein